MIRTLVTVSVLALAPFAAAAPTPGSSMSADEAYIKSVSLTQANYSKLSGDNAELRAMLTTALAELKDLKNRANSQDQAAKSTLVAFANNDTASGVDQLSAQAKAKAQSSAAQAASAANDYKAAGALAFGRDTPRAIKAYEAALALQPNDLDTLHQLAWLYEERLGLYDKALEMANRMIALPGNYAKRRGYVDRGNALWRKGDLDGAQAAQQAALDLAIKDDAKLGQSAALTNLANIAVYRKDYVTAESLDKRALALAQQMGDKLLEATALSNLGDDARARADYNAAESYLNRAIEITPDIQIKARSYDTLGRIAEARGNKTLACDYFKRSLSTHESIGAGASKDADIARQNIKFICPA
jgi:tetratricopeptide (TPR) repeat protein